jgi:hypothetical protein
MPELVVATISDQPDIEIVVLLEDEASILGTVEQSFPDVLIVGLDRSEDRPHICDVLLERFPHVRIRQARRPPLTLAAERSLRRSGRIA